MNKEKAMKTSWYIFLAAMAVLTILFFLDIKFVVLGLNILVLDMLTAGIWAFVRLDCLHPLSFLLVYAFMSVSMWNRRNPRHTAPSWQNTHKT